MTTLFIVKLLICFMAGFCVGVLATYTIQQLIQAKRILDETRIAINSTLVNRYVDEKQLSADAARQFKEFISGEPVVNYEDLDTLYAEWNRWG